MGRIGMSKKELRRVEVLARVKSKKLKVVDAASLVGVSYRHAKRLWKRYQEEGARGLKHRSAGRASPRAKPARFRRRVMKLVREKYGEGEGERFGPTLAAEHLASEDRLQIDAETLRRWMLEEGLWSRQRKRKPYRQRRERRRHFGELVQMDGSFHDWLEERGPDGCMMNMTDDATSEVELRLGKEETIWAAANMLRAWIKKYGVPQALYVDWKNLYKRAPTEREQLRGEEPVTQFGRMCEKLGITIIAAGSPQAKGRVESNHGTHQDRLIKKMRRKKIGTHERRTYIYSRNICRSTTGDFGMWQRRGRTITAKHRAWRSCGKSSGWRANGSSATTGWCDTTIGCFRCRCRVGSAHRRKGRWWSVSGRTEQSRSNIADASYRGRRFSARRHGRRRVGAGPLFRVAACAAP